MNFALTEAQETFVARARAFAKERVAPEAAAIDVAGAFSAPAGR
jgi:alkylation response protein AidB-like acyl-CoA dehydrogenase